MVAVRRSDPAVLGARTFVEACIHVPEPCVEGKLRIQGLDDAGAEDAVLAAALLAVEVLVEARPKIAQLLRRAAASGSWYLLLLVVQCR